jgi:hypothetical protein
MEPVKDTEKVNKKLLNNHNGLKRWRRYKLIEAILNN